MISVMKILIIWNFKGEKKMEYLKKIEEMKELKKKEMEETLMKLQKFDELKDCKISQNAILFDGIPIIYFSEDHVRNNFRTLWLGIKLNKEDVFEEIGDNLKELKIKEPFDIEKWKQEFVDKYNLCFRSDWRGQIMYNHYTLISAKNDVNYISWHEEIFENKHDKFLFDGKLDVYLKTQEDCEEFERVFKIMNDHLNNVPDLNEVQND